MRMQQERGARQQHLESGDSLAKWRRPTQFPAEFKFESSHAHISYEYIISHAWFILKKILCLFRVHCSSEFLIINVRGSRVYDLNMALCTKSVYHFVILNLPSRPEPPTKRWYTAASIPLENGRQHNPAAVDETSKPYKDQVSKITRKNIRDQVDRSTKSKEAQAAVPFGSKSHDPQGRSIYRNTNKSWQTRHEIHLGFSSQETHTDQVLATTNKHTQQVQCKR
jgi:hypothetical protein